MTPEQRALEAAEKIHYIGPKLLFTEKVEIILSALNAQREEDRATIAELTTDGNAATLAANLAQVSIERDRLQATVERATRLVSMLNEQKEGYLERLRKLEAEYESACTSNHNYEKEVANLRRELEKKQATVDALYAWYDENNRFAGSRMIINRMGAAKVFESNRPK